jgi:hypothetical protein
LDCKFCGAKLEGKEALIRHLRLKHRKKVKLALFEHPKRQNAQVKRQKT